MEILGIIILLAFIGLIIDIIKTRRKVDEIDEKIENILEIMQEDKN